MKRYLIIQGIAVAALMLGNAGIASANFYPVTQVSGSRCAASSTVTIADAEALAGYLQLSQSQQASLLSPANLYLENLASTGNGQGGGFTMALCLQPGYVTNVPAGIDTSAIFNQLSVAQKLGYSTFQINYYTATTSPYTAYPAYNQSSVNPLFATGIQQTNSSIPSSTVTSPTGTSSAMYSVSVDYSHFTAEAAKYGYQSVYTSSGSRTVSITVFKFNDSPVMTASQVIAKLGSMGYRPATLSELYALENVAGNNVVGLGTNLESGYGYPITGGTGGAGMSHSNGPFNTVAYKFAAVHN